MFQLVSNQQKGKRVSTAILATQDGEANGSILLGNEKSHAIPPYNLEAYKGAVELLECGYPVNLVYGVEFHKCGCIKKAKCGTPGKHPVGGWQSFTRDPDMVRGWFAGAKRCNVGLPTGVESGIFTIDVDGRHGGYDSLSKLIKMAGRPETLWGKSGNGLHLHFEHPGGHVPSRIGVMRGIDIRGDDAGVVAPGSRHESGKLYSWGVSPRRCRPIKLPDSWLFLLSPSPQRYAENKTAVAADQRGSVTQRVQSAHEDPEHSGDSLGLPREKSREEEPAEKRIQKAIDSTIPDGPGLRHRFVFELIRALKAIPEIASADPFDLEDIVREWHAKAIHRIGTKAFEETWFDFVDGWPRCRWAKGEGPVSDALNRARAAEVPEFAKRYEQPGLRLLVKLCRELHAVAGRDADGNDRPFFLAGSTAAESVNCDRQTAWRWLRLLVAEGVLDQVQVGSRKGRQASEYKYNPDGRGNRTKRCSRRGGLSDTVAPLIAKWKRQLDSRWTGNAT